MSFTTLQGISCNTHTSLQIFTDTFPVAQVNALDITADVFATMDTIVAFAGIPVHTILAHLVHQVVSFVVIVVLPLVAPTVVLIIVVLKSAFW